MITRKVAKVLYLSSKYGTILENDPIDPLSRQRTGKPTIRLTRGGKFMRSVPKVSQKLLYQMIDRGLIAPHGDWQYRFGQWYVRTHWITPKGEKLLSDYLEQMRTSQRPQT